MLPGREEISMSRVRVYLAIQAILWLLLVVLLCVSAIDICREGTARKAENPLESIYTTEDVARKAAPILPLFFIAVGMTAAGLVLGVKDEHAEKPVQDACTTRALSAARTAAQDQAAAPKAGGAAAREVSAAGSGPGTKSKRALQLVIAAAAAVLIVMGAANGSAHDVLVKAANICTECIGLG